MELIRTEDISNYCRQTTANESLKTKILADVDSFDAAQLGDQAQSSMKNWLQIVTAMIIHIQSMHLSWREQTIMMSVVT